MNNKPKTKKMYQDEIFRLIRILVQYKYDEDDDKNLKKMIQENLVELSKIETREQERREERKRERELDKMSKCF